jgi:hypothetical protein
MQESDGSKFHGIFILPLRWVILPLCRMLGAASKEIEGVGKQRKHGEQGAFGAAGIAGEVENKGVSVGDADAAAEGGKGGLARAVLANKLGEAGNKSGGDGEGGFGRDVAGGEAGAAGSDHEAGMFGGLAEGRGKALELVGEGDGFDNLGASGGQDADDGRAGEVRLGAREAAVADGHDDGGAASKGCRVRHLSRIDADARNRAEDEKIEGPASFWSGDLSRRTQPSPGHIRHRLTS